MNRFILLLAWGVSVMVCRADDFRIASFARDGALAVTNAFSNGLVTITKALAPQGPWVPEQQAFSVGPTVELGLNLSGPAAFYRAQARDLSGPGSWLFAFEEILDLPGFAQELSSFSPAVSVTPFIATNLSLPTQDLLLSYAGGPDPELQQALVNDLDSTNILQGPCFYDPQAFATVTLSPATTNLLNQHQSLPLQGSALIHLNRMLLEDAYPLYLKRKQDLGFPNLTQSYGELTTLAGAGGTTASPVNKWRPEFEGGPATNALLSRPHIAMADRAGNVYIADKEAHAIRKVTLDGLIHTVAGTGQPGYGATNPAPATSVELNFPNGLWVREDGTFYILDLFNGLIRKVDTHGLCTLLVDHGKPIPEGRGLWVSPDESVVFYAAKTNLMRWDTTNGVGVFSSGFYRLGNLALNPQGRLAAADPAGGCVYWIGSDGRRTVLAGNGTGSGGGDGYLATETGLAEVRGICFLPTGAYLLGTDSGSADSCNKVWYVDTDGYLHLLLNGNWYAHSGDGAWFYDPAVPKVSAIRQITLDSQGNLIITEHDSGYVRKVRFLPFVR